MRIDMNLRSYPLAVDGGDDLLRRIVEIIGSRDGEAGFIEDFLAELDIGAFEAHDERHLEADFLNGGDNAFGDDVTLHDATEDVDEDALDLRVGSDDLEGRSDLFL